MLKLQPPSTNQRPGKASKRPNSSNEDNKKEWEGKRVRKFLESWKSKWPWLEYDGSAMFCATCRRFPDLADRSSSMYLGTQAFRCDGFPAHEQSKQHVKCFGAAQVATTETSPIVESMLMMERDVKCQMINLFHIAYYVAKREKPFTDYPSLIALTKRTGSSIPNGYGDDKACARLLVDIYDVERSGLLERLQNASVFAVMVDGASDCATMEKELVYIRIVGTGGVAENHYLSIEDVKHANAEGVLAAIEDALSAVSDSFAIEWKKKLVAFGSDGASVNTGRKNGVVAKLKESIPYLVSVHCIAHRLELGVLDAIKQHPYLERLQECLISVYKQYHYSPKALRELRMIAEALEERVLKPVNLGGARWLPYIHRATKILCESYVVIVAHFEDVVSPERLPKPCATVAGRATKVLKYLKDYKSLLFTFFLCDVLDVLATLSLSFQKDELTACQAIEHLEGAFLQLEELKHDLGSGSKIVFQQVVQRNEYKGVKLKDVSRTILTELRAEVIDDIIDHLSSRLSELQRGSIIAKFSCFDPTMWPTDRKGLSLYGKEHLQQLLSHFEDLYSSRGVDCGAAAGQYCEYKSFVTAGRKSTAMRDIFAIILSSDELSTRFSILKLLFDIYLVIPVNTAVCERGFSTMKRIKSDWRSSLSLPSLQRLMYCSIEGPDEDNFDAEAAVNHWWQSKNRRPVFATEPSSVSFVKNAGHYKKIQH